MKILLSPAKLMTIEAENTLLKETTPKFINEASYIQSFLKEKTPEDLSEMMHISTKLADENWHRNQQWNNKPKKKQSSAAVYAFTGEVYRGLDAKTLDEDAINYLQKNLNILSGLYGILKPSDKVMLYRLEMGSNFPFGPYKNLYDFWKEKLTEYLNSQLKAKDFILNLASDEYAKVIDRKQLKSPVIDVEFKENKNGKLTSVMVYFKHARGLMARYCAENNITKLNDVKAFNIENYLLNDELSTDKKLVFVR